VIGPRPAGHWSAAADGAHRHLVRGRRYRVCRRFVDYDNHVHPVGETWTFLGSSFLPHDDGVSLIVSVDDEHEWHLRMRWTPEAQGPILDALADYVHEHIE
jgi:hypothetical protein